MENKIKIAFFDVDGTLFDHHLRGITNSSIIALNKLQQNGVLICIATGRPYEMLFPLTDLFEKINFDYIVSSNGQCIHQKEKLIYKNYMDQDDVQTIFKLSNENEYAIAVLTEDDHFITRLTPIIEQSYKAIDAIIPRVMHVDETYTEKVDHLVCYESLEKMDFFKKHLKHTTMAYWNDMVFDFIPDNGIKIHGIKKILNHLNLEPENVIAFGDGNNDLEMLEYCGIGVAMGNGVPLLKEVADYVTDNIENDGVKKALEHFNLI